MPNEVTINGLKMVEPLEITGHREVMTSRDGMDYLCTACTVNVTGTYNPATNAFTGQPGKPAPGTKPADTQTAIRHQLEQVRSSIQVYNGPYPVIKVTAPDVRNGPFVKVHDIQEMMGTKTFVISLSFVTYMNEANLFGNKSPILSHRWKMSDSYDQDYYLTRTVSGYAEFRGDYLKTLGGTSTAVPDQFRAYLWHPTPPGFKLDACNVDADSDGLTLDYSLVFVQKPIIVTAPGCTRIECFDSITLHKGNMADAAIGIAQGAASLSMASTIQSGFNAGAPAFLRRVHVKLWGYPNSNRSLLTAYGIQIMEQRFGGSLANLNLQTTNHDVLGRYVEIIGERNLGGFAGNWQDAAWGLAGKFQQAAAAIDKKLGVKGGIDNINGQKQIDKELAIALPLFSAPGRTDDCFWDNQGIMVDTNTTQTAAGPFLPNDAIKGFAGQGCRGTYVGQLAIAALLGQNATPPRPNLPALVQGQRSLTPAGGA